MPATALSAEFDGLTDYGKDITVRSQRTLPCEIFGTHVDERIQRPTSELCRTRRPFGKSDGTGAER